MTTVTNRAPGPRLFWERDKQQPTVVYPGETRDLALASASDPVTAAWLAAGEIEFGAANEEPPEPRRPQEPAPAKLETLTDDELRKYLADRGVKADGRWARDRLLGEARAVAAQG